MVKSGTGAQRVAPLTLVRGFLLVTAWLIVALMPASQVLAKPPTPAPIPPASNPNRTPSVEVKPEDAALNQEIQRASRLARQAENEGDYARALELWQFVYDKRPGDYSAYSGLKRNFIQLRRFDEGLAFIERVGGERTGKSVMGARFEPSMVVADRIEMLLAAERTSDALTAVERALVEHKGNQNVYRSISSILYSRRHSDEALAVLERGRREMGNPLLFAQEIAFQAESRMDWERATVENINCIRESPDRIPYITGVIADYAERPEAGDIVRKVLKQAASRSDGPTALLIRQLQAGLEFRARNYGPALEAYAGLYSAKAISAGEFLDVARQLTDERQFSLALSALNMLADDAAAADIISRVQVGRGSCYEAMGMPDSALTAYEAALIPGATPDLLATTQRKLGTLLLQIGRPPSEARRRFEAALAILKKISGSSIDDPGEIEIDIALTYLHERDFAQTRSRLEAIIRNTGRKAQGATRARLELARLYFRTGKPTDARQQAAQLVMAEPASVEANDALELMTLIDDLTEDSTSLAALGRCDLLNFIGRIDEAIGSLTEISAEGNAPRVVESALRMVARMEEMRGNHRAALEALDRIVKIGTGSLRPDQALFEAGRIAVEALNDLKRGRRYLETLILEYPESPLIEAARRRLRSDSGSTS